MQSSVRQDMGLRPRHRPTLKTNADKQFYQIIFAFYFLVLLSWFRHCFRLSRLAFYRCSVAARGDVSFQQLKNDRPMLLKSERAICTKHESECTRTGNV